MVSNKNKVTPVIPAGRKNWLINREISAHFRIVRSFLLGHLMNIMMLAFVFYHTIPLALSMTWVAVAVAACAWRLLIWQERRLKPDRTSPENIKLLLEINTGILAIILSVAIAYLIPRADDMQRLFLAIAYTAMIGAAGLTLRTLPRAAIAYISIVTAGFIFGLLSIAHIYAYAAIVVLVCAAEMVAQSSLNAHKYFIIRILRERELNTASETVRLLLNDYEDQGSDWLFELEADGTLASVCNRFTSAFGDTAEMLNGKSFVSLFDASPEREQLADHIAHGRAFRGLTLSLHNADEQHWWSVSARPSTLSANGNRRFRGVISDVSAEYRAQARARKMAHYDALTELPNRFHFNNNLERLTANLKAGEHFCLLLIDIDKFKMVNDTLGHPIGDQLLKAMSARISKNVFSSALGGEAHMVARLGGDEFGILMVGESVVDHAIRLCDALISAAAEPFIINGHQIVSGISVGLVIAPEDGVSAEMLMRNADLALYFSKAAGRGRWERFEPSMDEAVQKRHAMERDLRKALINNELQLYFQPLVNANSGDHVGFEALLRWNQPERGMVMPDDFIPLAEETGLIVPIGEWIIREAMAEAASWEQPLSVAVNISPVQMRSANLLPTLINALAVSGIDPSRFEIEITEGVLLHDTEENMTVLRHFHELGFKIALDDFGTGYSSLNYLRTFPFDKIKIDRSFISDLEKQKDCREIVSAVIGLANRLGMVTLAEGVEDQGQLDELRRGGCTMAQGWLFGKAMPAEHYTKLHVPRDLAALPEKLALIETALKAAPKTAVKSKKAA